MPSENIEQRKLAAIMFTDMVGYSALSQRDDKLAQELLEEHRRLLREIFPRFNGTEIKTIGDAFLIEFNSALEAAQCAIEIQRSLAKRNADAPAERQIQVRIGIHIGDVVHRDGDVYGDGVNIASRIERLAGPGGICVSMDVERQIRNAVETRFEKLAPTELKNISVPMELFRIVLPWERQTAFAAKSEIRSAKSETGARSRWVFATFIAFALIAATLLGYKFWRTRNLVVPRQNAGPARTETATIPEKSIAVLPFENLSSDKENAFFADGVQDEILTDLAKVAGLKVISRTSVMQYKATPARDLPQIAQALRVANILEGSVQRSGQRVRVSAQLIDARTDTHLWAENYDRDLSDVFAIQSEIAQTIADQLQAKLSPREKAALQERPTNDLTAYELYTKAKKLRDDDTLNPSRDRNNLYQAVDLLHQAVARDPHFLQAYCLLALANDALYFTYERSNDRQAQADAAVRAAESLQPNAGVTHLAKGINYYLAHRDYSRARAELGEAEKTLPNESQIPGFLAFIARREGRWEEAVGDMKRAVELDPNGWIASLGDIYVNVRDYKNAAQTFDRNMRLHASAAARLRRALVDFYADANLAPSRAIIDEVERNAPATAADLADEAFMLALRERNAVAAERAVAMMSGQAREKLPFPTAFCEGGVDLLRHDMAAARAAFAVAREQEAQLVKAQPQQPELLEVLSFADAFLGDKSNAIAEAKAACAAAPLEKDALVGAEMIRNLARVYALVGERQLALEQLAIAAKLPGGPSYGELKLDPEWDSLREDSLFEKIIASLAPKDTK